MRYYEMVGSLDQEPDRWFLGEPTDTLGHEVDSRSFIAGVRVETPAPLRIQVYRDGMPLDFTFAAFDMPVVHRSLGELIERIAPGDVQRIAAHVGDRGDFEILNMTRSIACVDESRTYIMRWGPRDGRPDKIGEYRMIDDLHIRPESAGSAPIFRILGWEIDLICSEALKQQIEARRLTGLKFRPV